jgi:hypothetical protein
MRIHTGKLLAIALPIFLLCSEAHGKSIRGLQPEHDWTLSIDGHTFGLRGYQSFTSIYFGSDFIEVRCRIHTVLLIASILPLSAAVIFVYAYRRRHHRNAA